jgi:ketol-acid reductoisomerase
LGVEVDTKSDTSHPLGRVAVLGYGSQGRTQALNLHDAGVDVVVGVRLGGPSEARAREDGLAAQSLVDAVHNANVVAVLLPDEVVGEVWNDLPQALAPGVAIVFAHGFNLLYGNLAFPEGADVVLVSPTGPGPAFRDIVEQGGRLPAYVAVHRDGTGGAARRAHAYAEAVGCRPVLETTVREETEVDLFGEQTVLCGGLQALIRAAFETLVEAGYSPQIAYLECVHQLKYLADLLHSRGPAGFRQAISATARYGDITRGPRVVGAEARAQMAAILKEIRSGEFAREWMAEAAAGRRTLDARAAADAAHPMEEARRQALGRGQAPGGSEAKSRNALSKN